MEVKIINDLEQFRESREVWNAIVKKMTNSTPFQTWEWNYYWVQNHSEDELFLLKAFEAQDVFGFAPLVIRNDVIQFIGDIHFDYGQFICAERKRKIVELFISEISRLVEEKKIAVHLSNIPIWSDFFSLCRDNRKVFKNAIWREQVDTAYIKLEEYNGFDGYLKAISTSLRKKALKPCLKEEFGYQIETFSEELWSDIERIYQERQEDRVGNSTLEWAKEIVRSMNEDGLIKISTIRFQGKRVAYLLFYEFKGVDFVWLTAFAKVEKYQLGHYIRYCMIKRAYEQGIYKVDMMRGAYNYKKQWDCNVSINYELRTFPNIVNKLAFQMWRVVRPRIKRVVYSNEHILKWYRKKRSKA